MNFKDLVKLSKIEIVRSLPIFSKNDKLVYRPCQLGKQTQSPHKKINYINTSQALELIHIDLMDPMRTKSIGGKKYIIVVVDDFSRFTWVKFLREKSDAFDFFTSFV